MTGDDTLVGDELLARLRAAEARVAELEGFGLLAGGVAHDLNNMLCGVLGGVELALEELEPGHPAREDSELVQRTAREAAELCRQLLVYSRTGREAPESVDLAALVASMEKLLGVAAGKRVSLRLELAPRLPRVVADPAELRHLLVSLVAHAAEAIGSAAGTITVRIDQSGRDAPERRPGLRDEPTSGDHLLIEVSDSGGGMQAAPPEPAAEPSFPGELAGRGRGLTVAQGIVRGQAGTLAIRNAPGEGSTLQILLPVRPTVTVELEPPVGAEGWLGRGLVLLVDDEPLVRTVGERLLERLGFEVVTAEDGQAALEVFDRLRGRIVLVVLDLTMPTLGGEATFRELRRRAPGVPVVLTSGYAEQDATLGIDGEQPVAFIQKPFQLEHFRTTLARALAGPEAGPSASES